MMTLKRIGTIVFMICNGMFFGAHAQTTMPHYLSNGDIDSEMQRINTGRKAMFDSANPDIKSTTNHFPAMATPAVSNVDIQSIAKRYEQRVDARKTDELMIFVSFSMPAASLKRLLSQARQVGASLVLNGFKDNSLKATTQAIGELGEASGAILINPNAFAKYEIKSVPTVVLAKPDAGTQVNDAGCALPDTYVSIVGDVSLAYALDEIVKRSKPFSELAGRYRRQIAGR
jgi:conjugal transfer pilus assembly protein TrbC